MYVQLLRIPDIFEIFCQCHDSRSSVTASNSITITGAQTDWCEFTAALPAVDAGKTFYLRFYFGQSGMELDAVTLDLLS